MSATLRIASMPSGALIYLDEVLAGETPRTLTVKPRQHTLRLEKEGYAPASRVVAPAAWQELTIEERLADIAPPTVRLGDVPDAVRPEEGFKLAATAEDNEGVVGMALFVDDQPIQQADGPSLRYNLDLRALGPGRHVLIVAAEDAAGNVGHVEAAFELLASQALPSAIPETSPTGTSQALPTAPTPGESPAVAPGEAPTAQLTPKPASPTPPRPTAAPALPVSVSEGELTIQTYAYEQALYTAPEIAGHPYPLLNQDLVGAPRPRTFQVLMLRNEYLELTLMPELGGRIYQVRYLSTGQDLLYNNRTIKPTHWGPEDQGWWLAVGGIEFCLPVAEHGYLTAEPWEAEVIRQQDGSATVAMRITERTRQIAARVEITLRPGEGGFHLRSVLHNVGADPASFQYWINAMLSPGAHGVQPSLRFYYPTSGVIVHSRGDLSLPDATLPMTWPLYQGRDLSRYANWRDWLGFFAPDMEAPFTAAYDEAAQIGLVRAFPSQVAQGVKLFGFGREFGDVGAYTDDGSQYVEMWGGLTLTFWDDAILEPQARVGWDETWYVISRSGGPSMANAEASLGVAREGDGLRVTVAAPRQQSWILRVIQEGGEPVDQPLTVQPDQPWSALIPFPTGNSGALVTVQVMDSQGRIVVSYTI